MSLPILEIVGVVGKVIDKIIPDPDLAAKAKAEVAAKIADNDKASLEAARDVVVAEANGESWMQRNWRPCLMFTAMGVMVWCGVAVPVLSALFGRDLSQLMAWKAMPPEMWTLLQIGVGGYVMGRTGEKMLGDYVKK